MMKWLFGRNDAHVGIELGDDLILSTDGELLLEIGSNLAIGLEDSSVSLVLDLDGEDKF